MSSTSPTESENVNNIGQFNVAVDIAASQPEVSGRPGDHVGDEGDTKGEDPTVKNADEETSIASARADETGGSGEIVKASRPDAIAAGEIQQETEVSGDSRLEEAAGTQLDTVEHQDEVSEGQEAIRRNSAATEDTNTSSNDAEGHADTHEGAFIGHASVPMSKNPTETSISSATPTTASNQLGDIPTSSFVRVSSPAAGSSGSILGSAPKKFSTVNINKKFLGKTAASPVGGVAASSVLGSKPSGGLGSLIRPSISPNPSSTSSHKLTSAKLTSVISSKPTTGALSSVPTVGWAKPAARPSPGLSPSTEHTALSSLNPVLLTESPKPTTLGLGSLRRGQLAGPSMGAGMGAGGRIKKEWAPIASGEGYRSGLGREFPTAGEVIEGQRQAQSQAQSIAQARAAHNAALIEGLDSFRGVNRDPNMHYWDEDDDENADDGVIDFGDGQTYTIAAVQSQQAPRSQETDPASAVPVSKEERFAEDFDRSWPPRGPPAMTGQGSRAIYNDRSNRFEAHADKLANQAGPPPRPQQILSRQGHGDRAVDRGYPPRQSDRSAHTDEFDHSRQPPPHLREGPGRHLPPHLADRGQERALPSQDIDRSSGSSRPPNHDLPPHLRDNAGRPPPPRADRHLPPHLEGGQDYDRSSRTNRWPGRDREPDADRTQPDSGRPRMQPLSQGSLPSREPSSDPAPGSSPKAQAVITPAVAPPETAPAPVLPPANDVEVPIDQKDEMHEAAERARLRRQQEESEREARAERARQKAKQLEDMMREKAAIQASSSEAPAPPRSPVAAKILARPVGAMPATTSSLETARLPPPHVALAGRSAEGNLPEIRRSEQQDVWRRSPQQVLTTSSGGNGRAAGIQQSHGEISKPTPGLTDGSRANRNAARSPIATLGSIALPADALDQPAIVTPVMFEFSGLDQVAEEVHEAVVRPQAEAHIEESRFGSRLNDAGTWRRAAESHRQAGPAAISPRRDDIRLSGLITGDNVPEAAERAAEEADPEPHYPYAMDSKTRRASRPAESENNFDEIMARIKSAIVAESTASISHTRVLPPPKTMPGEDDIKEDPKDRSSSVPAPLATKPVIVPSATYIVLPRPTDFITTQASLPMDPAPAWKTFTVKLPKSNTSQKTLPRKRTRSEHVPATPRGWVNTWNPPFEQLNPNTLSRDDWLIPANYIRGKAVSSVSLPRRSFQPHIKPISRDRPAAISVEEKRSPLAKESSQTVSVEESRPVETIARKIVVNLPRMTRRQSASSPVSPSIVPPQLEARSDMQAPAAYAPEAAQTTEDLDSLLASPTPSEKNLGPPMGRDRETTRQSSGRKLLEGTGVVFVRPHASSISEETEQPSSMRFMVSSELEIDNLLEEVNNMSMDGLTETIPEISHEAALQRESTKQPTARSGNLARSQAPSPNTVASAAWAKSSAYPATQNNPGLSSRDHIKNVWSHSENEQIQQSGNSLMGIADDLPPSLSLSMQDLKDDADKQSRRQNHLDADSPRFASIGPVRSDSSDRQAYARIKQSASGESPVVDPHAYGSMTQQSNGSAYGYPLTNDPSSPNNATRSGYLSPTYGVQHTVPSHLSNSVGMGGLPGQHRGQHGVWVPLNQAGMPGNGPMNGYIGIPTSPVYAGAAPMQKANSRTSAHSAFLGSAQSSGGMYSHPTGPLDSPNMSYMRPNVAITASYQSGGSHSAYPGTNSPYGNGSRDAYGGYSMNGMNGSSMRANNGTGANVQGHSRYASMGSGSMRSGGHAGGAYGSTTGYNDQNNRGSGMGSGGYNGIHGGTVSSASARHMVGSNANGGRSGMSANGSMERPW